MLTQQKILSKSVTQTKTYVGCLRVDARVKHEIRQTQKIIVQWRNRWNDTNL